MKNRKLFGLCIFAGFVIVVVVVVVVVLVLVVVFKMSNTCE